MLTRLAKIDEVKKLAGSIQKNAVKVDRECTGISAGIHRLLDQALVSLAGADTTGEGGIVVGESHDGAA
ncbi:MAG: hypothetical protein GEV28_24135 [Actinophytocola sp.]|uniref:hypothetical protein n=1 Tax=Actinophytocola sp. TaxID=1872138 RepID=UPI001324BBDC|nr:hypothetical protein [Actinophytocola sp.]MPZ83313.1 hypothetical protein [Actinophytocola sp.]